MKIKITLFHLLLIFLTVNIQAQVTVGLDKDPDSSALLDLRNRDNNPVPSTKGFLFPRVAGLDMTKFNLDGNSKTEGMVVYNTTTDSANHGPGLYYWDGNRWIFMEAYNDQAFGWKLDGNTNGTLREIGTKDTRDLPVISSGSEVMRIASGGNAGVGTPTPKNKFSVSGGALSQDNYSDGDKMLFMGNTQSAKVSNTSGWYVSFYAGSLVGADGNNLSQNTGNYSWNVAKASNSWEEIMRLGNNGNLGLGTVNPTAKLHVANGNALMEKQLMVKTLPASNLSDQALAIGDNGVVTRSSQDLNTIPQEYSYQISALSSGSTGSVTISPRTDTYYVTVVTGNDCGRFGFGSFIVGKGNVIGLLGGFARNNPYTITALDSKGTKFNLSALMATCVDGGSHQFDFDIEIAGSELKITNRNGTIPQTYEITVIER